MWQPLIDWLITDARARVCVCCLWACKHSVLVSVQTCMCACVCVCPIPLTGAAVIESGRVVSVSPCRWDTVPLCQLTLTSHSHQRHTQRQTDLSVVIFFFPSTSFSSPPLSLFPLFHLLPPPFSLSLSASFLPSLPSVICWKAARIRVGLQL